jgi:hypothetical protein
VLHKDPKKRPNMEQLKLDPFFESIDWAALSLKKVIPPKVFNKVPPKNQDAESGQTTLNSMFEEGLVLGPPSCAFSDKDYEESNKSYNRVKNYSFERI